MHILTGDARYISSWTDCEKPCTYRKYRLIGEKQKLPINDDYTDGLLLWSMTDDKIVSKFTR